MRVILLLVFLAGCGSGGEESSDNHGYGSRVDQVGTTGLSVQCNAACDVLQLEQAFSEVMQCSGLSAPPPFVVVVEALDVAGRYQSSPPLIIIKEFYAFRHEVVHYLLDMNTGNLDPNHTSPLFMACV